MRFIFSVFSYCLLVVTCADFRIDMIFWSSNACAEKIICKNLNFYQFRCVVIKFHDIMVLLVSKNNRLCL